MSDLPIVGQRDGVENLKVCSECGGKCCQFHSGICSPDDFGPAETLEDVLVERLASGKWCIDWYDGDPRVSEYSLERVYFIRPAHTNAIGKVYDPSWGGQCVFWNAESGCDLSFNGRPMGCRSLIPALSGDCVGPGDRNDKSVDAERWIPYQEQIVAAGKRTMDLRRRRGADQ